ncbi:MAG: trypsin-like peptidase domain-containing protein [Pontiellaceae bacterium]|nr:trypsin-like peptidase domain-containing protein [Pontiellaceae bacterium]MBN2784688.1 trypsin-like peptidase domain-containing protein [Pontiellaceae bacterium]
MSVRSRWLLIVLCGGLVFLGAYSAWHRHRGEPLSQPQEEPPISLFAPRQLPALEKNVARDLSNAIADAVEKVMPSVVVIRTEKTKIVRTVVQRDPFGFVREYRYVPEQLAGEGSGVIIDERGYIMTSYHVIQDAQWIEIVLQDGTKLSVTEVGHDEATDLAVLKIEGVENQIFPAVQFGDSDALRVGEMVIAIGSPFSLQSTATVGHVSQKGRRIEVLPYEDFIQTDVAINEGNSGGPLIDVDGRLVGINAAILSEAQEKGIGIAFAVPSNLGMVIAKSLIDNGKHEWPWVGASFGTYGVDGDNRLKVTRVWRETPAAEAGLQVGDRVISVDGQPMKNEYDVLRAIFNHSVGDSLFFVIEREEKRQVSVELPLVEFPGQIF